MTTPIERQDDLTGRWVECWNCGGEGYLDGECTCGEDCCCCLEPDPPRCSECRGKGGWYMPIEATKGPGQ
jgi:hypothetical protein